MGSHSIVNTTYFNHISGIWYDSMIGISIAPLFEIIYFRFKKQIRISYKHQKVDCPYTWKNSWWSKTIWVPIR